jgi:hypothetical protein
MDRHRTLSDTFEMKEAQQVPTALQQSVKYKNQTDYANFKKGEK